MPRIDHDFNSLNRLRIYVCLCETTAKVNECIALCMRKAQFRIRMSVVMCIFWRTIFIDYSNYDNEILERRTFGVAFYA